VPTGAALSRSCFFYSEMLPSVDCQMNHTAVQVTYCGPCRREPIGKILIRTQQIAWCKYNEILKYTAFAAAYARAGSVCHTGFPLRLRFVPVSCLKGSCFSCVACLIAERVSGELAAIYFFSTMTGSVCRRQRLH